jgi:hypothetical protein
VRTTVVISSSFSGIGCAEMGAAVMVGALNGALFSDSSSSGGDGDGCIRLECAWALELNTACQEELLHGVIDGHGGPNHLFGDVMDVLPPRVRHTLASSSPCPATARHMIMSSDIVTKLWCLRCGKLCRVPRSEIHIAGTPCQDFSALGSRSHLYGRRNQPFWAWASHRAHCREPWIVHENVAQMGTDALVDVLPGYVLVSRTVLCPTALGWPSKRHRQYCLFLHKSLVGIDDVSTSIRPAIDSVLSCFYRDFSYGLLGYLIGSPDELHEDYFCMSHIMPPSSFSVCMLLAILTYHLSLIHRSTRCLNNRVTCRLHAPIFGLHASPCITTFAHAVISEELLWARSRALVVDRRNDAAGFDDPPSSWRAALTHNERTRLATVLQMCTHRNTGLADDLGQARRTMQSAVGGLSLCSIHHSSIASHSVSHRV